MNRNFLLLASLIVTMSLLWTACGDAGDSESAESMNDSLMMETTAPSADLSKMAVCLWNEAGLRSAPGRGSDAKWVTAINFGELVTLTGEEMEIESEKRTYYEMILSGGSQGWSSGQLFAVDAKRAVSYGNIDLYKRPELTTFTGDQFEPGEMFAVMRNTSQPGWLEVYGKEKKKKGWIQENSRFAVDEVDVSVAILLHQALSEKTPKAKQEALERILSSSTFQSSTLIGLVEEAKQALVARAALPANQLYITATKLNVRAEASTESEVRFQVEEGAIATIIERGEDMIEVGGNTDYWYLIEIDGQEGWIFGKHTSKSLSE